MKDNDTLFIPRVDAALSKHEIFAKIENIGLGRIHYVVVKPNKTRTTDEQSNFVFVTFMYWFSSEYVNVILDRLFVKNERLNVIYDDPWFWKIMAYRRKPVKDMKRIAFIPTKINRL
jgi:hypothetical protein